MLIIPERIRREGIIIQPIPESVGRSRRFIQQSCGIIMNVPYMFSINGATYSIKTVEELAKIASEDYHCRRVSREPVVNRAIRLNNRREPEILGYVLELHARKGDSGLCTYFTRGCKSVGDFRSWIEPRVVCELKEDTDFQVPLNI